LLDEAVIYHKTVQRGIGVNDDDMRRMQIAEKYLQEHSDELVESD
jgi:hypothetical protein